MADVKKIATRESYGNALKELAEEFGVSYQAIQNRHAKILNRLRKFFN